VAASIPDDPGFIAFTGMECSLQTVSRSKRHGQVAGQNGLGDVSLKKMFLEKPAAGTGSDEKSGAKADPRPVLMTSINMMHGRVWIAASNSSRHRLTLPGDMGRLCSCGGPIGGKCHSLISLTELDNAYFSTVKLLCRAYEKAQQHDCNSLTLKSRRR
jgi:hypothetical protein